MNRDFLSHPAMKDMSPAKKELLAAFIESAKGKSLDQCIPLLSQLHTKMKCLQLQFTPQEQALMTEVLSEGMTPAEKAKLDTLKKLMKK